MVDASTPRARPLALMLPVRASDKISGMSFQSKSLAIRRLFPYPYRKTCIFTKRHCSFVRSLAAFSVLRCIHRIALHKGENR
jgi:hypothetical protein